MDQRTHSEIYEAAHLHTRDEQDLENYVQDQPDWPSTHFDFDATMAAETVTRAAPL